MNRRCAAATTTACLVVLGACSGDEDDPTELQVFAAASLTDAFDTLEASYEEAYPDIDVVLTYDSSATLTAQVIENAPVDVLATADEPTMTTVVDAGLVEGEPTVFATNTLVVVTPPDNPAGIETLDDLGTADFAVCVQTAPCGVATESLFQLNGFTGSPISEEDNVRGVLEKVTSGSVDAGLVYVSDALAAGEEVTVVEVENADQVVNADPIAAITTSEQGDAAQDWVDLVLSDEGQQVLADLGFGPPA